MNINTPDAHAIAVLLLTGAALFLYTRRIPMETTSMFVLVALAVGFKLIPYSAQGQLLEVSEFFHGFGHKALVAVCALMIMGQGLIRTGALEPIGHALARLWRRGPLLSMLATLVIAASLSAFVNNTPIVVLMLPLLIGVAVRNNSSPSGILLPMGLASLVGGMCTTIGTSTNLLVVAVAADMGMAPFNMFDFFLPAALAGCLATVYLWLLAPRLLPDRQAPLSDTSAREFSAQIVLGDNSAAVGLSLAEAIERTGGPMRVEKIQRGPGVFVMPFPDVGLRAGDRILTTDRAENLREFSRQLGGALYLGEQMVDEEHQLQSDDHQLAEVAVTAGSRLISTNLDEAHLLSRYGLRLLALHRIQRNRTHHRQGLDQTELRVGDVLLVQSSKQKLAECKRSGDFLVLDGSIELPRTRKAPLALGTLIMVVSLAAFGVLPIEVSAFAGCLVLITTGCLSWRDAANALSAQVILIVASSLALGLALMRTGAADFIAQIFLALTFGSPPLVILGGLILVIALLTNAVSNNAAAVIGTPIAIGIATRLGLPLEPFVLGVLFGANMSFATPMAYKTNLLVMNAGGYLFNDFVRVGLPLMVLMWLSLTGLLVYIYQLY